VLEQLEVVDGEPWDRLAGVVGDVDVDFHRLDGGTERGGRLRGEWLLLRLSAGEGRHGQDGASDGEC
jgi:hypothetical protein